MEYDYLPSPISRETTLWRDYANYIALSQPGLPVLESENVSTNCAQMPGLTLFYSGKSRGLGDN